MTTAILLPPDSSFTFLLLLVTMSSVLDSYLFPIADGFAVVCARELIRLSID